MNIRHAKTFLLGALALCFFVSLFSNQINSYWLFIAYDIGINIILAVSLNLINGYTGQFSLGHAGFMAVGAYTAAVITNQFGELNPFLSIAVFLGALLALHWPTGLIVCAVWLAAAYLWRFSSLSALLASASAPFVLYGFGHGEQALVVALMAALLWWKHSENIARLLSGTESRIGQKT